MHFAIAFSVLTAWAGMGPEERVVSGVILGETEIKAKAKAQGEILEVKVPEGVEVKAGEVLAVLDDRQEKIERDLASVESQMAQRDYEKTRQLRKYVSEEEILKKQSDFLRKKSVFELKEVNLSNKRVIAPIDGVVTRRYFNKGETVAIGDRVFDVVRMDPLVMDLYVETKDAGAFSKGKELAFSTDLHKDKRFKAVVTYVSPVVDPASGLVRVKTEIRNPKGSERGFELKPGTIAKVSF